MAPALQGRRRSIVSRERIDISNYLLRKLDIFMLRQFSALFAGTFFISLFVLMMQFVWKLVNDLIGKGLSLEVLGQFFWYMGLTMVPQALPLAVLLSSLITMGNLGESSELTAIKASGISLVRCLRSLFLASVFIACCSFYFQNEIGPNATSQMRQMLFSMRQKSPELEIPQGVFYNGIPNCNLYVQRKDMETGMLYGVMIYRMTQSYEDAAIILADSGMLQSTAEKRHLLLTLHNGEWFENMRSQELAGNANVPYRRESFTKKVIVLDFDDGFNLAEMSSISQSALAQGIDELRFHIDSIRSAGDSIGRELQNSMRQSMFHEPSDIKKKDSLHAVTVTAKKLVSVDSIMQKLPLGRQKDVLQRVSNKLTLAKADLEYRSLVADDYNRSERECRLEVWKKYTLSLTCVIFFFIGASLGAIIRKGGLGVPVIISVLVFIVFYILDNTGFRMAQQGSWTVAFGRGLAPGVLIPLAAFVTYKANKDSVVFNMDAYRNFFMALLGMRQKRNISSKEVVINDPDYLRDAQRLADINMQLAAYAEEHHLVRLPNPITVFFRYKPDHDVERMSEELEAVIDDLGNTRDRYVLAYLNQYPIVSEKAHTRPFETPWMNVAAAILLPLGVVLYIRMCRFRLRLLRDMKQISRTNEQVIERIRTMEK
ncbi:MAG: LptF/LptG family permease [Prevotella sp.]|nr:LptF/LptG family permease [Candidatus Prevotella equi]